MASGKYRSLKEARNKGLLGRFAKEHPTKGDKKAFDGLLVRIAKSSPKAGRTSKKD